MKKTTLRALQGSIEKWQDIVDGWDRDFGADNCPLCQLFLETNRIPRCHGCPVRKKTKKSLCFGSPYINYQHAETKEEAQYYAEAELTFLQSLLPKHKHKR